MRVPIDRMIERVRPEAEIFCRNEAAEGKACFFFSASNGTERARVACAIGPFEQAWTEAASTLRQLMADRPVRWLRVDWVEQKTATTWGELRNVLTDTKRNYFRLGISLDADLRFAFLETELNGNAMLYGGPKIEHAVVNEGNFRRYAGLRHGLTEVDFSDAAPVWVFSTQGLFIDDASDQVHHLHAGGPNAGRRTIAHFDPQRVREVIRSGSLYLASQVQPDGRFHYGWHPCFDRSIKAYNALRHASSVYAMVEAWEVNRSDDLKQAIDRALDYLLGQLIRTPDHDGEVAFLVEENGEIKLGGNAVALLALTKYAELTGTSRFDGLMDRLGNGIVRMQHPDGRFDHVLTFPGLKVKDPFRIIYYDGEAAFGLMRLYRHSGNPRWLETVERAFEYFIAADHWKAHDHWLGYAIDELSRDRPDPRYFEFAIRNVADHLDFVLRRITTFPTLLELMMASERVIARMRALPDVRELLSGIDLEKFQRALHTRAHYMLNGHFWPELAMFYANPAKICGSFFIRHHAFRVRIDDVEHYLSGYVAYLKYLERKQAAGEEASDKSHPLWTAEDLEQATLGRWQEPPGPDWRATGLCKHVSTYEAGQLVVARSPRSGMGVPVAQISALGASAAMAEPDVAETMRGAVLRVADSDAAILDIGREARERLSGLVLAVTGSAGKTTTVAMAQAALARCGGAAGTAHNANLPHGLAWNLASTPWDSSHVVVELAIGKMLRSARIARPHLAIFTNVHPAHLKGDQGLSDVARAKSRIFQGMLPGALAVLNSDMERFGEVYGAARARDLRIVTYGRAASAHYRLEDLVEGMVTVRAGTRSWRYRLGQAAPHHALNSVALVAAVDALGLEVQAALDGLEDFQPLPGRGTEFELVSDDGRIRLIDDAYNANPGSMAAALTYLGSRGDARRRVAVLGEMAELGDRGETYHSELADLVLGLPIDRVHVVGPIWRGFWDRLPEDRRGHFADDRADLAKLLRSDLADGDLVLVKGSHSAGLHFMVEEMRESAAPMRSPSA